jgi:hypothetical protein
LLKESESDRAARGEQIKTLSDLLKESESDRAARGEQIKTLSDLLKESESDRAARGEQIEYLLEHMRALFARRGFRWMTRYPNWPEVKKLLERINTPNE